MIFYTSVASTSAGGELKNSEVLLFGNSRKATSDFRIGHGVLKDAIDADGVRNALRNAGLAFDGNPTAEQAKLSSASSPRPRQVRPARSAAAATPCCPTPTSTTSATREPRSAR